MDLRVAAAGCAGVIYLSGVLLTGFSGSRTTARPIAPVWDAKSAASYLDTRLVSWTHGGAMDHGTFCISCHTGLPYAMGRASIRSALGERAPSSAEKQLLASVTTRVQRWNEVQPYLGDKFGGLGTESVLNALILVSEDAHKGRLSDTTEAALRIMWDRQAKTGAGAGAWPWINAGNEPWEAPDSDYWGATLAAAAVGIAPEGYARRPDIASGLKLLTAYLQREDVGRSLLNRTALLWAATKLPGLLPNDRRAAIVGEVLSKQRADGGWSTASLIPSDWMRHDGTPQEAKSDGYATGLASFVLSEAGVSRTAPPMRRALSWLTQNQDRSSGAWLTVSPNKTRDPATDAGKFMTDAATAFAVLALSRPG